MSRYLLIIKSVRRKPGTLLSIELEILASLARLSRRGIPDSHGYEIAQHVRDVADRKALTAYGTLYRALSRLEKMGLLTSRWEDPAIAAQEGRPGRRLYALTGAGLAAAVVKPTRRAAEPIRRRQPARA